LVVHNHNKKGGQNLRERLGCDYFTKSLAELSTNVIIFKGDLTKNVFLKCDMRRASNELSKKVCLFRFSY
jgi:Icc-related predicted phosphoesterase